MGVIKQMTAPIRSIIKFPLFQLVVVVGLILFLQAADDTRSSAGSSPGSTDWSRRPCSCSRR